MSQSLAWAFASESPSSTGKEALMLPLCRRKASRQSSILKKHWRQLPFRPYIEALEERWAPTALIVTNTNDSGAGSFRQAIIDSNTSAGVLDTIDFNISGSGVQTISPTFALPTITDPVMIDGTTQPGYMGTPLIELSGANAGLGVDGLMVSTGSTNNTTTIEGLDI